MANKIQTRRGTKAKLPTLSAGEPAFCTDTRELFIGTGSGNVNMGGSHWYNGTAMSGTSTTTGAYSYSACPQVKVGDYYLNTSNGYIYECTTAGSGTTAKWTYIGTIKGVAGKGISSTAVTYQSGTSGTTAPTGTWSSSIPSVAAGSYLWTRTVITYTDSTTTTIYSAARQGATGGTGQRGSKWYTGTAMSGTSTSTGAYTWNDSEQKYVNDMYLNTSNGNFYKCTTAGTGTNAKWTYQGCIKGTDATPAATYVVTNDTQLAAAVTALNASTYGGKIILREGTYTITDYLTCNKSVVFEGVGASTIINCTNHRFLVNSTGADRIDIKNITFNNTGVLGGSDRFIEVACDLYIINCTLDVKIELTNPKDYPDNDELAYRYISDTRTNGDEGEINMLNCTLKFTLPKYKNGACVSFFSLGVGDGDPIASYSEQKVLIQNCKVDLDASGFELTNFREHEDRSVDMYLLRDGGSIVDSYITCLGGQDISGYWDKETDSMVDNRVTVNACVLRKGSILNSIVRLGTRSSLTTYASENNNDGIIEGCHVYMNGAYAGTIYAGFSITRGNIFTANTHQIIYNNLLEVAILQGNRYILLDTNQVAVAHKCIFTDNYLSKICNINTSVSSVKTNNIMG